MNASTMSHNSVFVIEDNDEIREIISTMLTGKGYEVRSASGAANALAHLERESSPDVILLDLMMPGMSGWDFRVEQRLRPRLANIPVVAMSADCSGQAKAINADAYLAKPFEPQSLLDAIERVLLCAERNQLRAHLAESERLRALGVLAAGVAHEINNPLAVVLGCAELCDQTLRKVPAAAADEPTLRALHKYVSDIRHSTERIAGVVRGIATLGRPDSAQLVDVNVDEALTTSMRLVGNELRHRAELIYSPGSIPPVRGNISRLVQVFVNILMNAAHAIPEGAPRKHKVKVSTSTDGQGSVFVEISDTGCGMTQDIVGRIFEPFFTTKPVGSGMGLGLSIVHRLVTELRGTIAVTSRLNKGTSFRISLPAAETQTERNVETSAPASDALQTSRYRVLFIDDEVELPRFDGQN